MWNRTKAPKHQTAGYPAPPFNFVIYDTVQACSAILFCKQEVIFYKIIDYLLEGKEEIKVIP